MKNKFGTALLAAGIILVLVAAFLVVQHVAGDRKAGAEASRIAAIMSPLLPERSKGIIGESQEAGSMPAFEIEGHSYIGILEVPSSGTKIPLIRNSDSEAMKGIPHRLRGTAGDGSLIVYGYGYGSLLGGVKKLPKDSELTLVDVEGHEYHYRILDQAVIPSLVAYLEEASFQGLTIIVSSPGFSGDYVIYCEWNQ